jgi:predicted CopG family antitoxin
MKNKTITVSYEVWKKLTEIKVNKNYDTINKVIEELLGKKK